MELLTWMLSSERRSGTLTVVWPSTMSGSEPRPAAEWQPADFYCQHSPMLAVATCHTARQLRRFVERADRTSAMPSLTATTQDVVNTERAQSPPFHPTSTCDLAKIN